MQKPKVSCLELFSGAGGLAKGLEESGIEHKAFVEWNKNACRTLVYNYGEEVVHPIDIREFDFSQFGYVDMIAGGPPCQPFSMGGKHKGSLDRRDMFPYACEAIAHCRPKVFLFENVKGLLRKSFSSYFEYMVLRLTYPDVKIKSLENWEDHLSRLEQVHTSGRYDGIKYNVVFRLINSADYGIPQRRERVFLIGFREDLSTTWSFPKKTHSLDALLWSQFISGEYCDVYKIKLSKENLDQRTLKRVQHLEHYSLFPPSLKPWKTVREQIGQLPPPDDRGTFDDEHILRKGARAYPGHTGSYVDMPSKAIKAGDHGVPGGENMIRYSNGQVRYYTTYEAKRIQTFPSDYKILGSWTESMRQIGNAVPVELGRLISKSLVAVI